MKRILLAVVAAGLLFGGGFMSTAQAQGPHGHGHGHGYGHGHHGHHHANYCRPVYGYGGYRGPYNVYAPPYVPYGGGYSGGYQPYSSSGIYVQRPRFGLYLGF